MLSLESFTIVLFVVTAAAMGILAILELIDKTRPNNESRSQYIKETWYYLIALELCTVALYIVTHSLIILSNFAK